MTRLSQAKITQLLCDVSNETTTTAQGRKFEELVAYVFESIPGITFIESNIMDILHSEEIDLAFWNDKKERGFPSLQDIILIECKNWSNRVSSSEVVSFISKLRERSLTFGIIVAKNGITGNPNQGTSAQAKIFSALREGIRIVVLTETDLKSITSASKIVQMVKQKMCTTVVSGN